MDKRNGTTFKDEGTPTFLGESLKIKGEMKGEEPLRIAGRFEGLMEFPGQLVTIEKKGCGSFHHHGWTGHRAWRVVQLMRTGHVGSRQVNRIMLWEFYRNMSDADLASTYAYLRSPAARSASRG